MTETAEKKGISCEAEGEPFFINAQIHVLKSGSMGQSQYITALLIHFQKEVSGNERKWIMACEDHVPGRYIAIRGG